MTDIFISYSRKDIAMVSKLAQALEGLGYSVWWDLTGLFGGQAFDEVIQHQLSIAKCAIVVWSPDSVKSKWVRSEVSFADNRGILLTTIYREALVPIPFNTRHNESLLGWDGDVTSADFQQLLNAVSRHCPLPSGKPSFQTSFEAVSPSKTKRSVNPGLKSPKVGRKLLVVLLAATIITGGYFLYHKELRPEQASRGQPQSGIARSTTDSLVTLEKQSNSAVLNPSTSTNLIPDQVLDNQPQPGIELSTTESLIALEKQSNSAALHPSTLTNLIPDQDRNKPTQLDITRSKTISSPAPVQKQTVSATTNDPASRALNKTSVKTSFAKDTQIDRQCKYGCDHMFMNTRSMRNKVSGWLSSLFPSQEINRSYAVVIGINRFDEYNSLPTSEDPIRVKNYLLNEAGFDLVHVVTGKHVTISRLGQLMDSMRKRVNTNDRFLFYWQGHGETLKGETGKIGYLPLAHSQQGKPYTMLPMRKLEEWNNWIQARHALYLLDACFSGLAGVSFKSNQMVDMSLEELSKKGRHMITAGKENQQTFAHSNLGGSVFTSAILDGLRGAADIQNGFDKDGIISLAELSFYIQKRIDKERMRYRWRKPITPQVTRLSSGEGMFYFFTKEYAALSRRRSLHKSSGGVTPQGM